MPPDVCPLCRQAGAIYDRHAPFFFACERCGEYKITLGCLAGLENSDEALLPFLSAATRQAHEVKLPLLLTIDNVESYIEAHRWTTVSAKARKILEWMQKRSAFLSAQVNLSHKRDYPAFDAISPQECWPLMDHLRIKELIGRFDDVTWTLTMDGWEALEPVRAGGIPGRVFVAAPFSLQQAFDEGIKLALTSCGYDPFFMGGEVKPNREIYDKMLGEVRKAQFLVADVTGQNQGVYFEAGFAKALGKEVFWTCKEDDFDNVHFDTRFYGHIKWNSHGDLKEQLTNRVMAEIGAGPHIERNLK